MPEFDTTRSSDTEAQSAPDDTMPARPERRATLRLGQRQLGRIQLLVILLVLVPLVIGCYRLFLNFKGQRDIVIAKDNMHAIYNAMKAYSTDWDGKMPPAETWSDAVAGYLAGSNRSSGGMSYLHGPGDNGDIGYVYNDQAAKFNFEPQGGQGFGNASNRSTGYNVDPHRLVVLIERTGAQRNEHVSIPLQNSLQGRQALAQLATFPHNSADAENARTVILYADGHIDTVIRKDLQQ